MKASFHRMHAIFGSLALLAVAAGCGRERQPAHPVGRTPTFESEMPYAVNSQPPGSGPGHAPVPDQRQIGESPAAGMTPPGATPPDTGGQPGQPRAGAAGASDMNERQICAHISDAASVSAEDIPGGVQIVITPSLGAGATSLHEIARQLDRRITALAEAGQQPSDDGAARCPLFDMARHGARGRVVEAADGLRVLFTSEDTPGVATVREQARRFVQSAREGQLR
ncbi:uncharacterized protein SOCE26_106470 [Sorangium cellulosum]|uniref:Secreted protein n=1 Tax=Sorangium cellulosum TaxID=56 RepID=A0A2L0FC86_SORCE|nr:hypothetical protein [Sorangium cellulosum]AUX49102.1 uncharacterized protein SOCE26_106470 [Sorangium cellulosum]